MSKKPEEKRAPSKPQPKKPVREPGPKPAKKRTSRAAAADMTATPGVDPKSR